MHPTIGYQLAQAHLAGLRHHAQRDGLAHAARRTRPHPSRRHVPALPAVGRRVLAVLGARGT
jgi:hypothetical protein